MNHEYNLQFLRQNTVFFSLHLRKLPHASLSRSLPGSLLAHHRHLLSLGRMAASLKACIPSLSVLSHYQTSICFKKSLAFQR